jgi:hypothetical protein
MSNNSSLYGQSTTVGDVASTDFTTLYSGSANAIPVPVGGNTTYNIDSTTVTGGAGLNLTGSDGSIDTVKFLGTANITVVATNDGTITIDTTAAANTTYTIDASTTAGGANFNLVGSNLTTDTIKFAAGTNMSVVRTDANTITIANTQVLPTYAIDAAVTTGGALLDLTNSLGPTDSVKFASGSNITVSQTDANTITITGNVAPLANGTIKGQLLYWNGTAWVAARIIEADAAGGRLVTQYNNSTPGVNSTFFTRKNFGATNYTFNDGVAMNYSLTSTGQGLNQLGVTGFQTGSASTDPDFFVTSTVDNFTNQISLMTLNSNDNSFNGYNLSLLNNVTGTPTQDAYFNVKRGSSATAYLKWNEGLVRWEFNNPLYVMGSISSPEIIASGINASSVTIADALTTTSTAQVPLVTEFGNFMKIILSIKDNITNDVHGVEMVAIQNGSIVKLTTFAELYTNAALATFAVDISGGLMRLLVTPTSANSTTFKYSRTDME